MHLEMTTTISMVVVMAVAAGLGSMGLEAGCLAMSAEPPGKAPGGGIGRGAGEPREPPAKNAADTVIAADAVKVSMVVERETIFTGESIELAVTLEIAPGWHTYWDGDNDSGFPTQVKLSLPEGLTAGEIKWPVPVRHVAEGDILDYVYFDRCTLLIAVTADKRYVNVNVGAGEIVAEISWLVCREGCVPGSATVKVAAPSARPMVMNDKPKAAKVATAVKVARDLLPVPEGQTDPRMTARWVEGALVLGFEGSESLTFMPSGSGASVVDPVQTATTSKVLEPLTLRFKPDSGAKPGEPGKPVIGIVQAKVKGSAKPVNLAIRIARPG